VVIKFSLHGLNIVKALRICLILDIFDLHLLHLMVSISDLQFVMSLTF
jgi:hypothetical protein